MTEQELFAEWSAELARQNEALRDSGEEPVTIAELIGNRVDDTTYARKRAEENRVDRWWGTYNAALTGLRTTCGCSEAHTSAKRSANVAHGPLEPEPKP